MRHIASSTATTPSKVVVKGPLAFISLSTITVAAGAVADATAPNIRAVYIFSPNIKVIIVTAAKAKIASKNAIIKIGLPNFFITDTSNSLPILKAIIPRAKSPIKDNFSIIILFLD